MLQGAFGVGLGVEFTQGCGHGSDAEPWRPRLPFCCAADCCWCLESYKAEE